jgi:hypothetical protein
MPTTSHYKICQLFPLNSPSSFIFLRHGLPKVGQAGLELTILSCLPETGITGMHKHIQLMDHFFFFFFSFGDTGVWTQGLMLLGRHFTTSATLPALNGPFLNTSITTTVIISCFDCSVFVCVCVSGGTRVWTWGLELARQMLYHLSHALRHFCFSYFSDRVSHFCPG